MVTVITIIAQYVSIILFAIYGWICFSIFRTQDKEKRNQKLTKQIILIFSIHFLWYLVLFMKLGTDQQSAMKILLLYGGEILVAVLYMVLYHRYYKNSSRLITNNMCFLLLLGYTMLTRINFGLALKQFFISTATLLIVSFIPLIMLKYRKLRNYYYVYGAVGILALLTVFIPGTGIIHGLSQYGASNWLAIDLKVINFSVQPSEFVKILFIFFVASILAKSTEFRQVIIATAFAAAHVGVLVLEKDLGGALIFFIIYVVMLYIATRRPMYFFGCIGGACILGAFAFLLFRKQLFTHVIVRVKNWIDPWSDIEGKGYQIAQSLFAIGSGGWFGSGLGEGMPEVIPVRESDFIFSVIAEELGVLVALILILICFSVFIGFIDVSMRCKRVFYKNMAFGFAVCYIFQVLLNIGGATKFIPSTGVTLPLVSYGLSSVTSTLIIFQIIQGINIITTKEAERVEREKEKILQNQESAGISDAGKTKKRKK